MAQGSSKDGAAYYRGWSVTRQAPVPFVSATPSDSIMLNCSVCIPGFVVKKVVGSRPVTVAKDEALSTLHVGPRHVELDMDVGATYLAQKVCSVLQVCDPRRVPGGRC